MVKLATIRDFTINASAVLGQVERGRSVVVTRNSKPIAVVSPVRENLDIEDVILASDPYFLRRYEKARRSPATPLADLEKQLRAAVRRRGKKARKKANPKA
jgi:prevent-host-death family protein